MKLSSDALKDITINLIKCIEESMVNTGVHTNIEYAIKCKLISTKDQGKG